MMDSRLMDVADSNWGDHRGKNRNCCRCMVFAERTRIVLFALGVLFPPAWLVLVCTMGMRGRLEQWACGLFLLYVVAGVCVGIFL